MCAVFCFQPTLAAYLLEPRVLPLEVLFGLLSDSFNACWLSSSSSVVPLHFAVWAPLVKSRGCAALPCAGSHLVIDCYAWSCRDGQITPSPNPAIVTLWGCTRTRATDSVAPAAATNIFFSTISNHLPIPHVHFRNPASRARLRERLLRRAIILHTLPPEERYFGVSPLGTLESADECFAHATEAKNT